MIKIQDQKHSKETYYYSISRMLERGSYYGLRSLIVFYMVDEVLQMSREEALGVYGWVTISIVFSKVLGAILGDLLLGNRKSIVLGGIVQALGAFCLCIPSLVGLYLGLFLVVLGSGLYSPNLIANFGKLYLNKTKLLDSGFTLFYFAVNLGSFLGTILIGSLGETFGYNTGFLIAGMLMLVSIIPFWVPTDSVPFVSSEKKLILKSRVLKIVIACLLIGIYWGIYDISYIHIVDLQMQLGDISALNISMNLSQSINFVYFTPISIVAIFIWSRFYSTPYFKLMLGFIFGAISYSILFLIPDIPTEQHLIIYGISVLFLTLSEIYIAPILFTILTKYSNPKYLAILISLSLIPIKLVSLLFSLFNASFYNNTKLGLIFGIIAMAIMGVGLYAYILWNKRNSLRLSQ